MNQETITPAEYKRFKKGRAKYGNESTVKAGKGFHSHREANRYQELLILEKAGKISELSLQVKMPLVVNRMLVANYFADFVYIENDQQIVEDVKGMRTPLYNLKKKLVRAIYQIEIRET